MSTETKPDSQVSVAASGKMVLIAVAVGQITTVSMNDAAGAMAIARTIRDMARIASVETCPLKTTAAQRASAPNN